MTESLKALDRLVGTWLTEATHPAMPGVVVRGRAVVEWLEGARFLIFRAQTDHPQFPDSISIIGRTDSDRVENGELKASAPRAPQPLRMHYYDSRGVFRDFDVRIDATAWHYERMSPGFSQRFTGKFVDGDKTIDGLVQLCEDDRTWRDDLKISYRRG